MKTQKIVNYCGTVLDISRVKSMQVLEAENDKYNLIIELNERTSYVLNPATNTWEKEVFNDVVKIASDDFEMAFEYFSEWAEIWRDFSEEL